METEYAHKEAKRYSTIKIRIFVADFVVTNIFVVLFYFFLTDPLSFLSFNVSSSFYIAAIFFSSVFLCVIYLADFPLHFMSSFLVEKHFGLSRESLSAWFMDEAKSAVLSFAFSILCISLFYIMLRNFPAIWWIVCAFTWIFLAVILTRFVPVFIIPLFFRYLPIKGEALKERIVALAKNAGISLMDVCKIDLSRKTAKANAALVGLGRTRKVILADTLIDGFTSEEVEVVVAHEFGHFKHKHIWKLLAFSAITIAAGFFTLFLAAKSIVVFTGSKEIFDLRLLPLLVLLMSLFGIIIMPIHNLFSRILEREADRFALNLTANPAAFISMMKKLGSMNLSDTDPREAKKIFFYDHPPIMERIRMAEGELKNNEKKQK